MKKRIIGLITPIATFALIALVLFTNVSIAGSTHTSGGIVTDAYGNKYDLYNIDGHSGKYSENSAEVSKVQNFLNGIGKMSTQDDINNYIKKYSPKSEITASMIISATNEYPDVSCPILMAIMRQDSNFADPRINSDGKMSNEGTRQLAYRHHNPGNVKDPKTNTNAIFGTWQAGVDAVAANLQHRVVLKKDIGILIDTTRSMSDDISSTKAYASQIVETLDSTNSDYRVCLADYRDYPVLPYGLPSTDYVYKLDLPFSSDKSKIITAINGLTLGNGEDKHESVYSGLVKIISDRNKDLNNKDNYGWRKDADKFIIVMGDAPPHDPEPWTGGYSLKNVISTSKKVDPVVIYSIPTGSDSSTYSDFATISNSTGGKVYPVESATDLVDTIKTVLRDIGNESSNVVSAYITNDDGTVSVINTASDTITATVPVGNDPFGVAVTKDGTKVYVTDYKAYKVSAIDTTTDKITSMIPVGKTPVGVAVTPDEKMVYVANEADNTVSVINTATNKIIATVKVGNSPYGVAVTPDGKKVYVTNSGGSTVSIIDTTTNMVTGTVNRLSYPGGVTINPTGTAVYVSSGNTNTVYVIDTATNNVKAKISVGNKPHGVTVTPDGTKAYVANNGDNTVSVIDTTTNKVKTTVKVGSSPYGIAVTSDGTKVYVANRNSGTVSMIDTATNKVKTTVKVGNHPKAFGQFICTVS